MRVLYCPFFWSGMKSLKFGAWLKHLKISYVPLIKTGLEKYKELVTRTSQMEVIFLFYTMISLF